MLDLLFFCVLLCVLLYICVKFLIVIVRFVKNNLHQTKNTNQKYYNKTQQDNKDNDTAYETIIKNLKT